MEEPENILSADELNERIRTVRVAVIPGTEDVFLEEEDGKAWNLFYLLLQVVVRTAFVMYMILLICGK